MIKKRSGRWVWFVLNREIWNEIGPIPQEKTPDTEMMKVNPVRAVFRRGDCFYKLEMPETANPLKFWAAILFPKAKWEFFTLRMLARRGIPVTPPLGFGQAATVSMLVTREIPDAVAAGDYFAARFVTGGGDPGPFLAAWSRFVRDFVHSGFYHPDFHNGNILFREKDAFFLLVDVHGVRYAWFGRAAKRRRMYGILHEMREILDRDTMLKLILDCGAATDAAGAAAFYAELLAREAARTRKEWAKRKQQFLADYAKFVEVREENGRAVTLTLDGARHPFAAVAGLDHGRYEIVAGTPAELEALRLRDFELAMHRIPHLRVVAFEPGRNRLYREKPGETVDPAEAGWLVERIEAAGFDAAHLEFTRNEHGRIVLAR